jgi:hypothetical protein
MRVIGLDCATDESRIGVAQGDYEAGHIQVVRFESCSPDRPAASTVAEWFVGAREVILAIDAPLGWPVSLARALDGHKAGDPLSAAPDDMFRRETDRFIQREARKRPLEVGADRIARTAHAALSILNRLRHLTGAAIPLAWDPKFLTGVSAIEVHPAATLVVHGFRSSGYKEPQQVEERAEIVSELESVMTLPAETSPLVRNADVLDAVVCLLAAKDFLDGRAMRPVDAGLALQEGWIWTAPRGPRASANKRPPTPGGLGVRRDQSDSSGDYHPMGVIADASDLTAKDVVRRRVLCPACRVKVFSSWPGGWDAHVGTKCAGVTGENAEARKVDFKYRFGHLFR